MARLEDILVQGFLGGLQAASARPSLVDPSPFLGLQPGALPRVPSDSLAQIVQAASKVPSLTAPSFSGTWDVPGFGPMSWSQFTAMSPSAQAEIVKAMTASRDTSPKVKLGPIVSPFNKDMAAALGDLEVDIDKVPRWLEILQPKDQKWTISQELAERIGRPELAGAPVEFIVPYLRLIEWDVQRQQLLEQIHLDRARWSGQMLPQEQVSAVLQAYGLQHPVLPQPDPETGLVSFDQALEMNRGLLGLSKEQIGLEDVRRGLDFRERDIAVRERQQELAEKEFERSGQWNPMVTVHTATGPQDMPLEAALRGGFIQPEPDRPGMVQVTVADTPGGPTRKVWMSVSEAIEGGFIHPDQQLWTFNTSAGPHLMTIDQALRYGIITSTEAADLKAAQTELARAQAGGVRAETRWVDRLNRQELLNMAAEARLTSAQADRLVKITESEIDRLQADTERLRALSEQIRAESLTEEATRDLIVEELKTRIAAALAEEEYTRAQTNQLLERLEPELQSIVEQTNLVKATAELRRAEAGELTYAEKTALAGMLGVPADEVIEQPLTRAQLIAFRDWLNDLADDEEITLAELLRKAADATGVTLPAVPQGSESQVVPPMVMSGLRAFVSALVGDLGLEKPKGLTVADLMLRSGIPESEIPERAYDTPLPDSLIAKMIEEQPPTVHDFLRAMGKTPAPFWQDVPLTPQWANLLYDQEKDDVKGVTWGELMELMGWETDDIPKPFYDTPASDRSIAEFVYAKDEQENLVKTPEWETFRMAFNAWTRAQHGEDGLDLLYWVSLPAEERRNYLQGLSGQRQVWQPFDEFVRQNMSELLPAVQYVLSRLGSDRAVATPAAEEPFEVLPPEVRSAVEDVGIPTATTESAPAATEGTSVMGLLRHYWNRIKDIFGIEPPEGLDRDRPSIQPVSSEEIRQRVIDDAVAASGSIEAARELLLRNLDDPETNRFTRQRYDLSPLEVLAILEGD